MTKTEITWELKDWTVYPALKLIQNHQSEFTVKPRLMKLLEFFLQNHNEVVTREAILDYVWEDRIVTENLLTKSISELRKLLEEHFQDEVSIETIRNVGYRFQASFSITNGLSNPLNLSPSLTKKKRWVASLAIAGSLILLLVALFIRNKHSAAKYKFKTRIISSLKGQELSPILSPDGQNIAFAWRSNTSQPFHIYIRSLKENNPRKLSKYFTPEYNPAWSPDGKSIAYMRQNKDGQVILEKKAIIGDDELQLADLSGFSSQRGMIWTKDGQSLVFSGKREGEAALRLYAYDIPRGAFHALTTPPDNIYGDIHPSYAAETHQLAFLRAGQGQSIFSKNAPINSSILILDLQSGSINHLADMEYEVKELVYHPKLKLYLCWVSPQLGVNQLWGINLKGKKQLLRSSTGGMPGKGCMGKDHAFFFEYWQSRVDVLEYPLHSATELGGPSREYLNSTLWDWGLRFANRSNNMAFISLRNGFQEVWTGAVDAPESAMQVTQLQSDLIQSISLSPDGKGLLFLNVNDNQSNIYFVQTNGQNLQKLTVDGIDYSSPEWSPDGQHFYYSSNKSGAWEIWYRNLKGNINRRLTKNGGHTALPDPNHEGQFYFMKNNKQDTIWRMDLDGGKTEAIFSAPGIEPSNWIPQKQGIYYITWREGGCQLNYFDFATNNSLQLKDLEHLLPSIPALAIPPGGQSIFIAHSDEINADIIALEIE